MQTRFLRSQQDLKAKMLERQALGADPSANQTGENTLCKCSKFCENFFEYAFLQSSCAIAFDGEFVKY